MVAIDFTMDNKSRGVANRNALMKQKAADASKREARAAAKAAAAAKADRIQRRCRGRAEGHSIEAMLEMANPNRSAARIAFEKAMMEKVLKACEDEVCEAVDAAKEDIAEESVEFVEEKKVEEENEWELL